MPQLSHLNFSPCRCGSNRPTKESLRIRRGKLTTPLFPSPPPKQQVPELLGTTENELGIRKWLEDQGHTLVTTSSKEGEDSVFDKELVDAEIIITTP